MIFSSNCELLSAIFLTFLVDNTCVFFCFFFLENRGKCSKTHLLSALKSPKMVDTKSRFKLKKDLKYQNVSKKQFCIDFQWKNDAGKKHLIFNRKICIGF